MMKAQPYSVDFREIHLLFFKEICYQNVKLLIFGEAEVKLMQRYHYHVSISKD